MTKESPPDTGRSEKINCFTCGNFYITHDKGFPYGCGAMGFKSKIMPSREVLSNSGIQCQAFLAKKERR